MKTQGGGRSGGKGQGILKHFNESIIKALSIIVFAPSAIKS